MKKVILLLTVAVLAFFGYRMFAKTKIDIEVHTYHMDNHNLLLYVDDFMVKDESYIETMIESFQIQDPSYLLQLSTYDEDFFKSHMLLVINFNEGDSRTDVKIKHVYKQNDTYIVTIMREVPGQELESVRPWFFLIELDDFDKDVNDFEIKFEETII